MLRKWAFQVQNPSRAGGRWTGIRLALDCILSGFRRPSWLTVGRRREASRPLDPQLGRSSMKTRTVTVASFFSVAMAATLLGALYTTQVRHGRSRPRPRPRSSAASSRGAAAALRGSAGALGLETFRDVARAVNPGVVNISTSKIVRLPRNRDPFHDFGGRRATSWSASSAWARQGEGGGPRAAPDPDEPRLRLRDRQDGYILTNRHVIQGADEVSVSFPGDGASASRRRSSARTRAPTSP